MRLVFILSCVVLSATVSFSQTSETPSQVPFVRSNDGTRIAVECMGKGPSLLIVHGGTGGAGAGGGRQEQEAGAGNQPFSSSVFTDPRFALTVFNLCNLRNLRIIS